MPMPVPALDHSASGYSLAHAYWLAQAARAAYKTPEQAERLAREWGFDQFKHLSSPHTMPFPIEDTQAYIAASDRMVLVAFRGTESKQIRDWLTDTTTPPIPGPAGKGFVHYGFHRALDAVHPQIRDTVAEFKNDSQSVWFTGHSLGGALAMLAGARMHFEAPNLTPHGIYTYGQPRTCDRLLATAYDTALGG
ncbi:lipase family protein, partial [Streptomyces sp. uw30]|uniref:lipase family protein n=1 Tax=Streptomyces sp. uw30 TaxID=1828179 RepID=UPI0011CE8B37